jgi:hypothetical protein
MDTNGNLNDEALVSAAYERVKADLAAVKPEEFIQINLDIPTAVSTIIGVLPEVKALRPQIEKELPTFDLAAFDKLEDYAWALSYAQSLYLTATQPPDDLAELGPAATQLRERLLADAGSLANYGLVDSGQLAELKGANGIKNIAQDLQILVIAMQANWANIQGKAPTTAADLDTALRMSARLMRIVGLREQGPAQLAAATDQRLRAFTLVLNVYDDVRRAVGYLRAREDDADSIAPALHPGRPRRKQADPPAPPANTPPSPAVPSALPKGATPPGPTTPTDAGTDATKTASGNSQGPFVS